MKALSIKQPWASLIAHGIKNIENRTWKTKFRGRIFIHASAKGVEPEFTPKQTSALPQIAYEDFFPNSAIIGEVDIVDCVIGHSSIWAEKEEDLTKKPIYNWVLENPMLYDKPILNVKGKLSFWKPDIDLIECIACGEALIYNESVQDDGENYYHVDCYNEMLPLLIQEANENKTN